MVMIDSNALKLISGAFAIVGCLVGCSPEDPQKEDTPEMVTKATLTFSSVGGAAP